MGREQVGEGGGGRVGPSRLQPAIDCSHENGCPDDADGQDQAKGGTVDDALDPPAEALDDADVALHDADVAAHNELDDGPLQDDLLAVEASNPEVRQAAEALDRHITTRNSHDRPDGDGTQDELLRSLADPAELRAAENRARLVAEEHLRLELADEWFEGAGWTLLAEALARYGLQVVTAWIVTGEMFVKSTLRGRGVGSKPENLCHDDAEDLAQEVVFFGIRQFQRLALKMGRWDPARGAAMKTYFIGGCIGGFSNVYTKWRRGYDWLQLQVPLDKRPEAVVGSVEIMVITSLTVAEALATLSDLDRHVIDLYVAGVPHEEIARQLELRSEAAVTERIRRIRLRLSARQPRPRQAAPTSPDGGLA